MVAYFEKIVNALNQPKTYLWAGNFLLVLILILLSNSGVLPIAKIQDFIFFAAIGLIFALYRPGWAFLFFVGTIALENINLAPASLSIAIRPYQFIGGLTILALAIRYFFKRTDFDFPKWKIVDSAVVVFALAGFISTAFTLDRGVSLKQSMVALAFAALYYLTRIFIQNLDDLKRVAPFFLSSSSVVVLYGIWQNVRFSRGLNSFETMAGRPNASFTEADWLGIYLVLLLAVLYSIIYYFYNIRGNGETLISPPKADPPMADNFQFSISKQFLMSKFPNFKILFLYLILSTSYILLILTVSRSAWLGAVVVTVVFLVAIFTQLKLNPKEWQWKKTIRIKIPIIISLILSIALVYFFHLTTFQLWSRAQSTGSGLQKITVSCSSDIVLPSQINSVADLQPYDCRHINLEEINAERQRGNFVKEINRPDPNVNIRSQIYQKSWASIKAHPILGIGWGNSGLILGKDERGVSLNSSNIFLETWLGSGILGLLALVIIWCYTIYKGGTQFLKNEGDGKALGLFILLGSIAILTPNLFNAGIFLGFLWLSWGVSMANGENRG